MLAEFRSIHFVGICGTAMASVAAALKEKGIQVTGSDQNVYPPMSTFLAERNVEVFSGYSESNLEPAPDLVVIGNAMSRGNAEVEAVLDRKLRYCSLPELLKEAFIRGKRSLVVAGTHGKTSTTSLLVWVFEHNGLNPSFLVGGIPNNIGQGARFTSSDWFIIEGDEYDTAFFDKRSKFVHYLPEVAILNNLEFDHADIFEDLKAIRTSFRRFVNLIPGTGLLLANGDDPNLNPEFAAPHCPMKWFGFGNGNDVRASQVELGSAGSRFQVDGATFEIQLIGELYVRNALAVVACARHCGLTDRQIQSAFSTFTGVKRRMEERGCIRGVRVVDDFGHHPTAIRETLKALRVRYPGGRIWAVFEPRSNTTRRNVFQRELAEALGFADCIVMAQVARLELLMPSERLNPELLIDQLKSARKAAAYLPNVDAIVDHVASGAREGDVICVFSNGGFGGIHERLMDRLSLA